MFIYYPEHLLKHHILLIILTAFSFCLPWAQANDNDNDKKPIKTIIIDPGHGGHDMGAKGIANTDEKSISLTLARMLESVLVNKYTVVLTRTDDFWINLTERTAKANHLKADLFISIHASGSFLHQAGGISIFYYKNDPEQRSPNKNIASKSVAEDNPLTFWNDVQNSHIESSMILSDSFVTSMTDLSDIKVRSIGAPLGVLAGADMPAVLIEIGYLTNPIEEKKLNDENYLTNLTEAIAKGIDSFFQKKSDLLFINLHG